MEKITLSIKGMSCVHCVQTVKTALESLPSVSHVVVSLETNTATLSYDPARVEYGDFLDVIRSQGYDVE